MSSSAMNNINISRTDWDRIDAMTDEDIDISDIPPLTDGFFAKARLRMPNTSVSKVSVAVDAETLAWFQAKGDEQEQYMTIALRTYVESQQEAQS
jgi:uncharacterized protein (DUF4415 family)